MSGKPPLSDNEVYDRLYAAMISLGAEAGATARGDTSIKAARRALMLLQVGLLAAMEAETDVNRAIKAQDEPSAQPLSDPR